MLHRASVTDATRTAQAAGHRVRLYVETEILRNYFIPFDDEEAGVGLVGEIILDLHLALAERIEAKRVSYGRWLSLEFEFALQHRRKAAPEIISLQAVLGPCTSNTCSIWVFHSSNGASDDDAPF